MWTHSKDNAMSHHIYSLFTYNYSLLIDRDFCESLNLWIKFPCALVYLCLSSRLLYFFCKGFPFLCYWELMYVYFYFVFRWREKDQSIHESPWTSSTTTCRTEWSCGHYGVHQERKRQLQGISMSRVTQKSIMRSYISGLKKFKCKNRNLVSSLCYLHSQIFAIFNYSYQ